MENICIDNIKSEFCLMGRGKNWAHNQNNSGKIYSSNQWTCRMAGSTAMAN